MWAFELGCVLGFDHPRKVGHSLSLVPAVLAGVAFAVVVALLVRRLLGRRSGVSVG